MHARGIYTVCEFTTATAFLFFQRSEEGFPRRKIFIVFFFYLSLLRTIDVNFLECIRAAEWAKCTHGCRRDSDKFSFIYSVPPFDFILQSHRYNLANNSSLRFPWKWEISMRAALPRVWIKKRIQNYNFLNTYIKNIDRSQVTEIITLCWYKLECCKMPIQEFPRAKRNKHWSDGYYIACVPRKKTRNKIFFALLSHYMR